VLVLEDELPQFGCDGPGGRLEFFGRTVAGLEHRPRNDGDAHLTARLIVRLYLPAADLGLHPEMGSMRGLAVLALNKWDREFESTLPAK
jgi:hypothetical protein